MGGQTFWATETHIHWEDGSITPNAEDGTFARISYSGAQGGDYSLWSDEERKRVIEKTRQDRVTYEAEQAERDAWESAMLAGIKAKLDEEEWNYVKARFEYTPECGWPDESSSQ